MKIGNFALHFCSLYYNCYLLVSFFHFWKLPNRFAVLPRNEERKKLRKLKVSHTIRTERCVNGNVYVWFHRLFFFFFILKNVWPNLFFSLRE